MKVEELSFEEQNVLVAVVRHLVLIDGELSDSELYDLIRLGYALGRDEFREALAVTEHIHEDEERTLAYAASVERPEARSLILKELARVAQGDGVHDGEAAFLEAVAARWA